MNEDDLATEALLEFLNGCEAGIESARQLIKSKKLPEETLDYSKLAWIKKTGNKGEFETTNENENNNSEVWQSLKEKLKSHKGFWRHEGFSYWFDRNNELVIDRRKTG
jgi:hypothetical protein